MCFTSGLEYIYYLVNDNDCILHKVLDYMIATNVKLAMLTHIFDIVDQLLRPAFASNYNAIAQDVDCLEWK